MQTTPSSSAEASPTGSWLDLAEFDNSDFDPGRGILIRTLWHFTSAIVFENGLFPFNGLKCSLLRAFGAKIGRGVVIKPDVRIKFPWRLAVGKHTWIGQEAWIDNIAEVTMGSHVCISQGVYLCTGSHDHRKRAFDLIHKPIRVGDGAWLAARSTVLPGVTVGANALVAAGSVANKDVEPGAIVAGIPGAVVGRREPPTS